MKNRMKKIVVTIATAALAIGTLAGCGSKKDVNIVPDTVDNFKLDFESGEFSFDFDGEAKSFYVRVFASGEKDETMPLAARRVRYRSEQTAYSGNMNLGDLQPGDSFDAYVYTYVKDSEGDLHFSTCEALTGVYKTAYKTPSKNFNLNNVDGKLVLNLTNSFFTDQYKDKEPKYEVTLYKGDEVVETKTIAYSDLSITEETSTNFFGQEETTTNITGSATFDVADPTAEYFATLKIVSTNDKAYYDSEASEKIPVTEPVVEEENAGGAGGFGGFGGGDGGFGGGEGGGF